MDIKIDKIFFKTNDDYRQQRIFSDTLPLLWFHFLPFSSSEMKGWKRFCIKLDFVIFKKWQNFHVSPPIFYLLRFSFIIFLFLIFENLGKKNFLLILPRTVTTNTLWMLKNWEVIYKNIVLGKLRSYVFQPARYILKIRSTEFCAHTFQTIHLLQTMYRNFQLQHLSTTIIPNNRYNRSNDFHSNQ